MRADRRCWLFAVVFIMLACPAWAEETVRQKDDTQPADATTKAPVCPRVVPLSVAVSTNYWSPDQAEALKKLEVPGQIELAILCELDRQGYGPTKPFDLKITIVEFSLRSGEVTIISGISPAAAAGTGLDILTVNVEVQTTDGGFRFDVKEKLGRMFVPSPAQRTHTLAQAVAKTVTAKVKKKGLLKDM